MTISRISIAEPARLTMSIEELRSLKWLVDRAPAILLEARRDGELRELERRVMERDLLLIRHKLQGVS